MSDLKLTNGFRRMTIAKLLEKATIIHQQISTNSSVFVSPSPTMAELLDAINELTAANAVAASGDRVLIIRKNTLKEALVVVLHNLGNYVLFVAKGDYEIAVLSGFSVAKKAEAIDVYPPQNMQIAVGEQSGWMDIAVDPIYGSGSFVYQYSTEPNPDTWQGVQNKKSSFTITGLTPGTLYYFRVGVVGSRNQLFFSDTKSRVAS